MARDESFPSGSLSNSPEKTIRLGQGQRDAEGLGPKDKLGSGEREEREGELAEVKLWKGTSGQDSADQVKTHLQHATYRCRVGGMVVKRERSLILLDLVNELLDRGEFACERKSAGALGVRRDRKSVV